VARDDLALRVGQLAVDDVEVGAADGARVHLDDDLLGARLGSRELRGAQRPPRLVEHHRAHHAASTLAAAVFVERPRGS